ncbi:MAG TPA: methionyl-tRNA formyltransferase [Candidatus Paceibacterota bacterium]|nr:methionyl-tRNA formyltransferase [Candidatus Paceibacterota bacterium]
MNERYIFFGTPKFSAMVLEAMKMRGFLPSLIVTAPDKPKGRKMLLTPPEAKVWAEENNIPFLQPPSPKDAVLSQALGQEHWDFFVVASYGKILPKVILEIPEKGVLNIHPSLLPKLRGASPIHQAILEEDETGVSIMLMDAEMDHGDVLAQRKFSGNFPAPFSEMEKSLADLGADMLCEVIPRWVNGEISPTPQNHTEATFSPKIIKEDAHLDLNDPAEKNYRKILAFEVWPKPFFFARKNNKEIRVIVKKAELQNGELVLKSVLPEGRNEMTYEQFQAWIAVK